MRLQFYPPCSTVRGAVELQRRTGGPIQRASRRCVVKLHRCPLLVDGGTGAVILPWSALAAR